MTSFWSFWTSFIILGTIFGCLWLVYIVRKSEPFKTETDQTVGHSFDGIEELDNPMPSWWVIMFVATCIWGFAYAIIYPTLGNDEGLIGWTSTGQWEEEVAEAEEKYAPIFNKFAATPLVELAQDAEAMKVGQRLFANNCSVCHGSSGRGALGFPNLTDGDWLYGGEPETIKQTIMLGRNGQMPAKGLKPDMTNDDINDLTHYLLAFSKRSDDTAAAGRGAKMFQTACAACHGADAKGLQSVGAPNLTDNVWLYGASAARIKQTLLHGRAGVMPAQEAALGEKKVHILAAYVYSLSQK